MQAALRLYREAVGSVTALTVLTLVTVSLVAPQRVAADGTEWRHCVDGAWGEYNGCLMESSGWFDRKVCDIAFQLDVVVCSARVIGEIKEAAAM
jgi:hypothetical protein